jgi:peptide deformylase
MREKDLVSLTAPQIGYKYRVFCVKFGPNAYRTFINPVMQNIEGLQLNREKCSSIPDKQFILPRYNSMILIYQTPLGEIRSNAVKGKTAMLLQHCVDHLDGLLISYIGLEVLDGFDDMTDDEKDQVIKMYLESLDIKLKYLQDEIKKDPELSKLDDAIKFMGAASKGEINFEPIEENNN